MFIKGKQFKPKKSLKGGGHLLTGAADAGKPGIPVRCAYDRAGNFLGLEQGAK